ncbi:MAG: DUF1611 domain-containing protein [Chloroflexia bacterium]|nr:DUF1611 domain-containing protein [Chloroflexia bacterium]
MSTNFLEAGRLGRAKAAYTTRRAELGTLTTLVNGASIPREGDLVLARVMEVGQHPRVELPGGRKAELYLDDEVVLCYGNRYAPDQFEAEVPNDLDYCHMVAGGGVAARVVSWHFDMEFPTVIEPVGLLADRSGRVVNLREFGLPSTPYIGPRPRTIAVVGTAMNAGKTTTAAGIVNGLTRAGLNVGAAKVTGTGAGKDLWLMRDAGAQTVLDFTDAGYPSTYKVPLPEVEQIVSTLTGHLAAGGAEAIILEVADGLYQYETACLLASPNFRAQVDGVIFAAGDAMGATAGVNWLQDHGLPVAGVGGLLTASPLAMREAVAAVDVPVLDLYALCDAGIVDRLGYLAIAA